MNILVFGKDGQLGRAFQDQLQKPQLTQGNNVRFIGRKDCDLGNSEALRDLLHSSSADVIINAAAYTAVDKAEAEGDLVFAINTEAPEVMAQHAASRGAMLLHYSTDYVFDGLKQAAYSELDPTNPLSMYGKSKEAGERAIISAFAKSPGQYLILRTSWVYGDGGNFIRTILRLAKEHPELRIVDDQFGVPTSAQWLAELGLQLTTGLVDRQLTSGIYHAVPRGETNWFGLASLVLKTAIDAGEALQVSPVSIKPIPTSEFPLPAPRPMNSRLSTQKLQIELERLGLVSKLPHWETPWDKQVVAYVQELLGVEKMKVAE